MVAAAAGYSGKPPAKLGLRAGRPSGSKLVRRRPPRGG